MKSNSVRRKFITLFRTMNTGLHNLVRNTWLTTAAVAVMIVTLTVISGAVLANYALQEAIEVVSRDLTISVFLQDDSSEQLQNELENRIASSEFVDEVLFKSKADALSDFQVTNADNLDLLNGLAIAGKNPLPASFEIFMNDINEYQAVLDIANDEAYVDVVRETNDNETSRKAFNGFIATQDNLNKAGLVLGVVFGSISILVIFNTIRMAIFTRSDEIEMMKLIGATPSYIRGPYLFEAALYGFIASIVSFSIIYALAVPFARRFAERETAVGNIEFDGPFPDGVALFFDEQWILVLIVMVLIGVMLGLMSSSVAMAKYLRLKKW